MMRHFLTNFLICLLWGFIGLQQFVSLEDCDQTQVSTAEKVLISICFLAFGPCIMISNVILELVGLICGNDDDDHIFRC